MNGASTSPKSAELRGVEIFSAGPLVAGNMTFAENWTLEDLDAMARNFDLLKRHGLYTPAGKISHVYSGPAMGEAAKVYRIGERLFADMVHIPPNFGEWIKHKAYRRVSIEADREAKPNLAAAAKAKGITLKGPILKAIAFLGSEAPAVYGLAPLPEPTFVFSESRRPKITRFSHCESRDGTTLIFSEVRPMTRQEALDILVSRNADVSAVSDSTPDTVLESWAASLQAAPGDGSLNFAEIEEAVVARIEGRVNGRIASLNTTLEQAERAASERARVEKANLDRQTRVFCENMAKEGRLSPAEIECDKNGDPLPHTVLARLLRADTTITRTFSENGKTITETELQAQMEEIRRRPTRKFGERIPVQGSGTGAEDPYSDEAAKKRLEARWNKKAS